MPEPQVLLNPITEEKGFDNFPGDTKHRCKLFYFGTYM